MTKGEKWLGKYQAQQNKVWIINEEDSERNVSSRLEILGYKGQDLPLMVSAMKGFSAENPKMVKALLAKCKEQGVGVIMFDTLRAIHHGNENDSAVMQIVLDNLKMFSREGITVVFNHHHKKSAKDEKSKVPDSEMQRGSSAISAAVSGHISLEEEQREDGTFIILKHLKSKVTEKDAPIQILINKKYKEEPDDKGKRIVESIKFEVQGEYIGVVYAVEKAKEEVLKVLKDRAERWVSKKELNELCACGKSNLDKSLAILLDNNLMHKSTRKNLGVNIAGKGAMNELFFTYRNTEQESQSEMEYEEIKGW
jgi:RecA-family ATPase